MRHSGKKTQLVIRMNVHSSVVIIAMKRVTLGLANIITPKLSTVKILETLLEANPFFTLTFESYEYYVGLFYEYL